MLKANARMNVSYKIPHLSEVHECTPNVDIAAQELEPIVLATPILLRGHGENTVLDFHDIDTVSKVPTTDQIGSETIKRVSAGVAVKQPSMSYLNLHPEDQVEQSSLIETTSDLRNLIKGLQANEPLHLNPSHRKSSIESLLRVLTLMERHHFPTSCVNK
jgi:hypothetical protein